VVILHMGDRIPADGRVIESINLQVEEAALTGESVPVEKHTDPLPTQDLPVGDRRNMVFMGTIITSGRGQAILTSTGMATELGRIAQMVVQRAASGQDSAADLVSQIEDPAYRNRMVQLAMSECHWDRQGCERVLAQFESRRQRRQGEELQRQIEEAEKNKDMDLLLKLLQQKQKRRARI
ncbi:MAG: hypothetical protein M0036_17630, partial [Desulfobacteraceae bacterium]|nr:hypothetical protein [Desulfobacteraceae bacterium]